MKTYIEEIVFRKEDMTKWYYEDGWETSGECIRFENGKYGEEILVPTFQIDSSGTVISLRSEGEIEAAEINYELYKPILDEAIEYSQKDRLLNSSKRLLDNTDEIYVYICLMAFDTTRIGIVCNHNPLKVKRGVMTPNYLVVRKMMTIKH